MESGSKVWEGLSFSAWTSSNSSLDSATGNLHITDARNKMEEEEEEDEPQMTLLSCLSKKQKQKKIYVLHSHQ